MWNGKRTDRVEMPRQLRIDPDLGKRIRARSALNRRTIQQELLHLIEKSLKAENVRLRRVPSVRVGSGESS